MSEETYDMVDHPRHYSKGSIECIDAMEQIFSKEIVIWHCAVTAFKYIWRYQNKNNPKQDIEKSIWYLTRAFNMSYEIAKAEDEDFDISLNDNGTCTPYLKSAYEPTIEMYIAMALNTYFEHSTMFNIYDCDYVELCQVCKSIVSYLNNALRLMNGDTY